MRLQGYIKTPSYIGEFRNGVENGKGTVYLPDGRLYYQGTMKNGGCSGEGTLYIYVDKGEEGSIRAK